MILFCLYTNESGIIRPPINLPINSHSEPPIKIDSMETESTLRLKYIDDLSFAESISMNKKVEKKPFSLTPTCNTYRERTGHTLIKEECEITNHITSLEQFSQINQMKINTSKTKMVLFNPMRSVDVSPLGFTINGDEIGSEEEFKLLGLKLSSNLSWNSHINYIIKKANSRIWTLIRLKNNRVATHFLIRMYKLWVRSLFEFMAPAFMFYGSSYSKSHKKY